MQLLQQQVTTLADTQSSADERYARAKADNAVLQARVHMLDEQIREVRGAEVVLDVAAAGLKLPRFAVM